MYRVRMINFGYYLQDTFDTVEAAINAANKTGFQYAVEDNQGRIIKSKVTV